jgi:hypothetical protein
MLCTHQKYFYQVLIYSLLGYLITKSFSGEIFGEKKVK